MKSDRLLPLLLGAAALAQPAIAQTATAAPATPPSPGEIVNAAPASDWIDIPENDLLVMTLAPDARGKPRHVVIQLIPAPFSSGWVNNIKALARAHWYDGIAVVRVQDNYVAQWGDPNGEDEAKAKKLPAGLMTMTERDYVAVRDGATLAGILAGASGNGAAFGIVATARDSYADAVYFKAGWPLATSLTDRQRPATQWPVHCYGYVGVGRGMLPDAGSGAELYAVIGHAPRHLDRNIAVVGRVIEGIEHLSSLPRGTGPLGFYEKAAERTPILSVRVATDLPTSQQPHFQFLATEGDAFRRYADARSNRRDPFFIVPAGGADICNIPVPIRRKP